MWLIIGAATILIIALVAWAATRGRLVDPPPPWPPETETYVLPPDVDQWDGPITLSVFEQLAVANVELTDIALFQNGGVDSTEVTAIELSTRTILWQAEFEPAIQILGDDTGLAIASLDEIKVVDPRTGDVTAQASQVYGAAWAGHGVIVTNTPEMCVRTMAQPDTCTWTATSAPLVYNLFNYSGPVFGNGLLVNTGDGVRDLATGARASFGADAGGDYPELVYYSGEPDRVFRVVASDPLADATFQPWHTPTDTAISGAVTARYVVASPAQPIYIAVDSSNPDRPDAGFSTAYVFATGEDLWLAPNYSTPSFPARFIGDDYLQQISSQQGLIVTETRNLETGEKVWYYPEENAAVIGVIDTVLYMGRVSGSGHNLADAGKQTTTFDLPGFDCMMQVVAGHVIAYGIMSGEVYVLKT